MKLVRDVMSSSITSINENATIDAAIELIVSKGISGIPIVNESGSVVGVLSECDVLPLYTDDQTCDRTIEPCSRFMSRKLRTIQANATVATAVAVLKASSVRRLIVLERDRLVGMLSRRDVIRAIRQQRAEADMTCSV